MEILIFAALLGLIPALIASNKGGNFIVWWVYGTMIFIVAIIHALMMSPQRTIRDKPVRAGFKNCPYCAGAVSRQAIECKHCRRYIPRHPAVNALEAGAYRSAPRDVDSPPAIEVVTHGRRSNLSNE